LFKEKEKLIQTSSKQIARGNSDFRNKEMEYQKISKRLARRNPYVLEKERIAKQVSRSDYRNKEKERISDSDRKINKRKNPEFKETEQLAKKIKKHGSDIDNCIAFFHKNIRVGPQYICTCCNQTWFKQSVLKLVSYTKKFLNCRY